MKKMYCAAWSATHTHVIKIPPVLWNWATWIVCIMKASASPLKSIGSNWHRPPPRWSYEWDAWVRALLPCSHIKALQGSKCFKSATSRQRQFYAAKGFRMSASWIENDWNHQVNEISKENESSGSKLSRQLIATLIRSGRDRHQHFPEIHREQIS